MTREFAKADLEKAIAYTQAREGRVKGDWQRLGVANKLAECLRSDMADMLAAFVQSR